MIEATLIIDGNIIKYRDLFIKQSMYGWHVLKSDYDALLGKLSEDDILIGVSDIEDAVNFCIKYYEVLE